MIWNDDFRMLSREGSDCEAEVRVLHDRARLVEAGCVVFHVPTLDTPIERLAKRPGQVWVAWSMESEVNYPQLEDPSFMAQFDLTMTYRRDADLWVPYLPQEDYSTTGVSVGDWRTDGTRAPAVYVASNPAARSRRDDYVRELMRHIDVDSYGRCLNNRRWPEDHGRPTKLDTFSRYPFTLAFENSISRDYVTEKFFDPLLAGSVPVYLGAPDVADLAPGESCYIDVADFAGPGEVARHLQDLLREDAAYRRLHRWRAGGPRPEYRALRRQVATPTLCRLGALLAARAAPG